jgi:hypothetical protein
VSGTATVDPRDSAASMSLTMDYSQLPQAARALGTRTLQMAMILDRRDLYVKMPQALVDEVPSLAGKPSVKVNLSNARGLPGLSSLGNGPTAGDPAQMLQELRAHADRVTALGPQLLDGVSTTHYRADFNSERLPSKLPSSERSALQGQEIPVDAWIDSHHLVRRMVMSLAAGGVNGSPLEETISIDIGHYGPQPRPLPPPADQVTDASSMRAGLSS